MTARRFMVGDKVALSETPAAPLGEVATFQDVGDRQILRVRDDAGQLHAVVVQLSPETSEVIAGPMSLDEVRAIARAALSSGARIPVTQQVNILASAVLMLAGDRRAS